MARPFLDFTLGADGIVDGDGAAGVGDTLVTVIKKLILEIWAELLIVEPDKSVAVRSCVDTTDPDGIGGVGVTTGGCVVTGKGCDVISLRDSVVLEVDAMDADRNEGCNDVVTVGCDVIAVNGG